MTSIDRDPNQDQTPGSQSVGSPWQPPAPEQIAHSGNLPGSLNEQPVEEGVGPLREGIYEAPATAEAIAPATAVAPTKTPDKTTPITALGASPETPKRGRRAGRVIATVAALAGIGTAALVIGTRSGGEGETETEATPAAAGDPSPEATTAEPEDPVVVPPTEAPAETAPAVPAPTTVPRPTTTDAQQTTTTAPETTTTLTPEAPLLGAVEIVGLQGLQPGANPIEFTRPSGATEVVPSLDGSSPEMLVKTALNLVAAHATGGNEATGNAFTLNPDVRVGFLNDLRQQVLDFRGDDSGDWQATIFGHPYDPAEFEVREENGQITVELVGGTLFLERLSDSFGNNEWQGDWILQGVDEDFTGRGAVFDQLSMVIGPRDGQLSVNSINFNYIPTHS